MASTTASATEAKAAKLAADKKGLVAVVASAPVASLAPYLTPQGALLPLQFDTEDLPLAWQEALTRAAREGTLAFPFSNLSPTWDPAPLFRALCDVNPFASVIYTTVVPFVPRGETLPVRHPSVAGEGLHGFVDETGQFICLRIVRDAGRLVSGYSEPARIQAARLGHPSVIDVWRAEAGAIAAKAAVAGKGLLTRRAFAAAVWQRISFGEVTAFPVEIARACYMLFNAKRVLDACGGWGDRLAAALSLAPQLELFVCVDPNPAVHKAYDAMVRELGPLSGADPAKYVRMQTPFEDVPLRDEPGGKDLVINSALFDLVFTSPPFFNLERYCDDASQSIERYKALTADMVSVGPKVGDKRPREDVAAAWKQRVLDLVVADTPAETANLRAWFWGFLRQLLERSWARLRVGGHMVLSINDYKTVCFIRGMLLLATALPGCVFMGVMGMDLTHSTLYDGTKKAPFFVWRRT